jgi:hypothetical protein
MAAAEDGVAEAVGLAADLVDGPPVVAEGLAAGAEASVAGAAVAAGSF